MKCRMFKTRENSIFYLSGDYKRNFKKIKENEIQVNNPEYTTEFYCSISKHR